MQDDHVMQQHWRPVERRARLPLQTGQRLDYETNGVPQICVEWQKAFLTSRTQRVKLANAKSDWTEVDGGVPQGTLSGPENFLNMIDDLHTEVDDVKFVDDVTLYEVCNTHSQNKLQNAEDDIQEWATDNNMSLNTNKTKELLVYFGREDLDITRITINGDTRQSVCVHFFDT